MMLNSAGKVMSPRCERIYSYLNHRGIMLNTMSTDMCVKREYPRLEQALEMLQDALKHGAAQVLPFCAGWTDAQLEAAIADCQAVMRRLPENRSVPAR